MRPQETTVICRKEWGRDSSPGNAGRAAWAASHWWAGRGGAGLGRGQKPGRGQRPSRPSWGGAEVGGGAAPAGSEAPRGGRASPAHFLDISENDMESATAVWRFVVRGGERETLSSHFRHHVPSLPRTLLPRSPVLPRSPSGPGPPLASNTVLRRHSPSTPAFPTCFLRSREAWRAESRTDDGVTSAWLRGRVRKGSSVP